MLLCACPERRGKGGHYYIAFVNKSERKITCQMLWSGHITEADTLFQCRKAAIGIPSDSSYNFSSVNDSGWETDFKAIPFIQFLVLDDEIYGKYITPPICDTIRKYVPILYCYQLTLQDLQRMNWTVAYPPEE